MLSKIGTGLVAIFEQVGCVAIYNLPVISKISQRRTPHPTDQLSDLASRVQGDFNYRSQRVLLPDETVAIPGFPNLSLDLSLVFPA
ncbi:MAG: hypothetical protein EAZ78_13675 [Oscillatoriales cyanobacterium]|nr:MAG: hypothetical protein EAZ78_13675 [Oscillatoriales cyanobacterium]